MRKRISCFVMAVTLMAVTLGANAVTVPEYGPVELYTGTVWNIYLSPLVISESNFNNPDPADDLQYGTLETLKISSWTNLLGPGNFGFIDIGVDTLTDQLALQHEPVQLGVGDRHYNYTGSKSGAFVQGMNARLTLSDIPSTTTTLYQDGEFDLWATDGYPLDSRLMIIPVIEDLPISGVKEVTIVGFASFYIDAYDPSGADTLTVMFTSMPEGPPVPEPSSLITLFGFMAGGLTVYRRRLKADN